MPDPIAIWGAVTGTAGLAIALGREVVANRRALRVERGWHYVFDGDRLRDVWVYVMAWNTGRRPLHIEHVGFEFIVPGPRELADKVGVELPPENTVWVNQRVEIALNGETLEVVPDGPSVKICTRIAPILGLGVDPTSTTCCPFVVTVPEHYWWGSEGPLLARPPQGYAVDKVERELAELALEHLGDDQPKVPREPGEVVGVPRLLVEGYVEHTSDLLPDDIRSDDVPEA